MTLVLSNEDVEKLLTVPECIDVLERTYIEMSEGRSVNRVRSDCLVPSKRKDAIYSLKSMDAGSGECGQRFRSIADSDSDRSRTAFR